MGGRWRICGGEVGFVSAERGERRGAWVLFLLALLRTSGGCGFIFWGMR